MLDSSSKGGTDHYHVQASNDYIPANANNGSKTHSTEASLNITPLWTIMDKMVPPKPHPQAKATMWRYQDMRKELSKAAETVSAEEAERRVLILVNEDMRPPYTTDTIYSGLQIVLPGEIAPAHRHRAFALRFIIEGSGGFTAVEGERMDMSPGDVILTPSWTWHDHGNDGTDPVIWLDGLDLPVWQFLPINFMQMYAEQRYPSTPAPNSALRWRWEDTQNALDSDERPHVVYHYHRINALHLSTTISGQAEKVVAGYTTEKTREVVSFVYHVYSGSGFTTIKSPGVEGERKISWTNRDTFAVPAWSEISHVCTNTEGNAAYLFAINDRPLIESLTFVSTAGLEQGN